MALRTDVPLSGLLVVVIPLMAAVIAIVMSPGDPAVPGDAGQARPHQPGHARDAQPASASSGRSSGRGTRRSASTPRAATCSRPRVTVNRLFALTIPTMTAILNLSTVAVMWFGALRVDSGAHEHRQPDGLPPVPDADPVRGADRGLHVHLHPARRRLVRPDPGGAADRRRPSSDPGANPRRLARAGQRGMVEFRDVEFRYPGAEEPVLATSRFSAEPGQTTAIVGSTGSGKSTIVNLIPRLYDATAGSLFVDGVDVREMAREDLWRQIGLVPAEGVPVQRHRREQPALRRRGRHRRRAAGARSRSPRRRDFVREMEGGLEAPITQGGTNVSGGQRQRLAIARALVKRGADLHLRRQLLGARLRHRRPPPRGARARARQRDRDHRRPARRHDPERRPDRGHGRRPGRRDRHPPRSCSRPTRPTARSSTRSCPRRRRRHERPDTAGGPTAGGPARRLGRPRRVAAGGPGGMMGMGMGLPPAKSKDFRGSLRRLFATLRPERPLIALGRACWPSSASRFAVIGPQDPGQRDQHHLRGRRQQAVPGRHDAGAGRRRAARAGPGPARRPARRHAPGARHRHRLRRPSAGSSSLLVAVYRRELASSRWMPGLHHGRRHPADRLRLREDVDAQARPAAAARTSTSHPRGDLLSRVTNDIDNIGQSLQQSLTQLITSLLTIVGVLIMMLTISPLLARRLAPRRAGVARRDDAHRPALAEAVRGPVGVDRHAQRPRRGDAHRPRDREGRSAASGRRSRRSTRENERLYEASYQGAVHLRDHPAGDELHLEPQLRRDRRHRRPARRVRADVARRRRRLHPVLAPVHVPDHPDGEHRQRAPVGRRVGGARLRAARRAGGDRRPGHAAVRSTGPRRGRLRGRLVPLRAGPAAHRRPRASTSRPATRSRSSARPAPARRRSSTC